MRLSLSRHDVEHSDLKRVARLFEGRFSDMKPTSATIGMGNASPEQHNMTREALAVYFLGLIAVSLLSYATLYYGIDTAWPDAFVSARGGTGWLDWIYFSVATASTFGDGEMHVMMPVAQMAVMLQIITGPLLIFWLISVLVDRS
jgi:hypothetical protein